MGNSVVVVEIEIEVEVEEKKRVATAELRSIVLVVVLLVVDVRGRWRMKLVREGVNLPMGRKARGKRNCNSVLSKSKMLQKVSKDENEVMLSSEIEVVVVRMSEVNCHFAREE